MQTEEWLKAAWENFEDAYESKNISLAKDIIADTLDAGFLQDGQEMALRLRSL